MSAGRCLKAPTLPQSPLLTLSISLSLSVSFDPTTNVWASWAAATGIHKFHTLPARRVNFNGNSIAPAAIFVSCCTRIRACSSGAGCSRGRMAAPLSPDAIWVFPLLHVNKISRHGAYLCVPKTKLSEYFFSSL